MQQFMNYATHTMVNGRSCYSWSLVSNRLTFSRHSSE